MEELKTDSLASSNSADSISGDESVSSHTGSGLGNPDGLRRRYGKEFCNGNGTHDTANQSLDLSPSASDVSKLSVPSIAQLDNVQQDAKRSLGEIQSKFNEDVVQLLENVAVRAANSSRAKGSASIPNNISFSYSENSSQKRVTKKTFTARDSLLTDLLKINHFETLYNISIAVLMLFTMQTVVYDLLEVGRIRIDFTLISWGFGKFPLVMSIWLMMMASTLSVFPMFNLWSYLRRNYQERAGLCDVVFVLLYAISICGFLAVPAWAIIDYDLPPASSLIILCEQVRLIMKIHAFIRENAPNCINAEKGERQHQLYFSKYLYFLFAPTLIYRDEYPRTDSINWNVVVSNLLQIVICIFYFYFIFMRFVIPIFHNFNSDHVTPKAFVNSLFGCMMPGTLCLLIGFFVLLHLWMNAWAEMVRFGDRLFYKDWWNATSFASYHRNWNIVVHDWLYTYLYLDIYMALGFKHRWLAMHLTFFVSAVAHEYIISTAFKFIYPVLFLSFELAGVGMIYVLNGSWQKMSKIGIWFFLVGGTGTQMALYSMEWYARINCPATVNTWTDYLIPRSWYCESLSINHLSNVTEPAN